MRNIDNMTKEQLVDFVNEKFFDLNSKNKRKVLEKLRMYKINEFDEILRKLFFTSFNYEDKQLACSYSRFTNSLSEVDLDHLASNTDYHCRILAVEIAYDTDNVSVLNTLLRDYDWRVREAVAECGRPQDLDVLVHDLDWHVRAAVVIKDRDKDISILVNDPDWRVRAAIATHSVHTACYEQKLFSDPDPRVVRKMIKYNFGHATQYYEVFSEDKDPTIRNALAQYTSIWLPGKIIRRLLKDKATYVVETMCRHI